MKTTRNVNAKTMKSVDGINKTMKSADGINKTAKSLASIKKTTQVKGLREPKLPRLNLYSLQNMITNIELTVKFEDVNGNINLTIPSGGAGLCYSYGYKSSLLNAAKDLLINSSEKIKVRTTRSKDTCPMMYETTRSVLVEALFNIALEAIKFMDTLDYERRIYIRFRDRDEFKDELKNALDKCFEQTQKTNFYKKKLVEMISQMQTIEKCMLQQFVVESEENAKEDLEFLSL